MTWLVVNHDTDEVIAAFDESKEAAKYRRQLEASLPEDDDTNYWIVET